MKKNATPTQLVWFMGYLFTILLFILMFRLFYIQIIIGNNYANQADAQNTVTKEIHKIMGDIVDRNGIPFTQTEDNLELIVLPDFIHSDEVYSIINQLTGKTKANFSAQRDIRNFYYREPIILSDPIILTDVESGEYPGIILYRGNMRYDDRSLARHVVGHIRKSDGIPITGIEKAFESYLHPDTASNITVHTDGRRQLVPGWGYTISPSSNNYPYDVKLTLDYVVQDILEKALDSNPKSRHGGIVIEIETGDILALASRPHYTQNDPLSTDNESLLAIPFQQFEPGSVYKIVVAAAALEYGGFENKSYYCEGGIQLGSRFVSCHPSSGGLGELTLREAFAYSCNDTFIRIAMELGGDLIIEMSEKLGLGKSLEIELYNQSGSLTQRSSYLGAGIGNLAIGQGDTLVTPLQMANMIATIANDGEKNDIRLVMGLITDTGQLLERNSVREFKQVISPHVADTLMDWMGDVTLYGTGIRARDDEIGGTGGKTGTPQVSSAHSDYYGWFTGFFPQDNPRYAIVIMSKEKGGAGNTAAPIFLQTARGIWEYERSFIE